MENVRNLSISLPGDSDGFHVNREFIAYPISGPGGQIVIIPVSSYHNQFISPFSQTLSHMLSFLKITNTGKHIFTLLFHFIVGINVVSVYIY